MEFLEECLEALRQQSQPHTVVVVENGSTDESREFIKAKYPEVSLLCLDYNQGCAGGLNRGIEAALNQNFELIALLNNDAVPDSKWLEKMIAAIQKDPKIGIVTPKILHKGSNLIHTTGDFYSIWGLPFPRGMDEVDRGQYDDVSRQAVFGGSGGASLYRAEMLNKVALFDEDYFCYYEDVDISFRAQMGGWNVHYEPQAIVHHVVGGTNSRISGFIHYHAVKNLHLLYWRNMPAALLLKYFPRYFFSMVLVFAGDIRRGQLGINIRAMVKVLKLTPKTLQRRKLMGRNRRVSTSQIDSILYHQRPPTGPCPPKLKPKPSG